MLYLNQGWMLYRFLNNFWLHASYSQNSTGEQFFMNQILINRSSISNRPLKFAKSQNLGLNYTINDLFNQFELSAGWIID
jgi:hypothetical protein